jgi:hypothetical protein
VTPKEIITKHVMRVKGIRIPEAHRVVEAAMGEMRDYDYVIIERSDLLKNPEQLRVLYGNPTKQNRDH